MAAPGLTFSVTLTAALPADEVRRLLRAAGGDLEAAAGPLTERVIDQLQVAAVHAGAGLTPRILAEVAREQAG